MNSSAFYRSLPAKLTSLFDNPQQYLLQTSISHSSQEKCFPPSPKTPAPPLQYRTYKSSPAKGKPIPIEHVSSRPSIADRLRALPLDESRPSTPSSPSSAPKYYTYASEQFVCGQVQPQTIAESDGGSYGQLAGQVLLTSQERRLVHQTEVQHQKAARTLTAQRREATRRKLLGRHTLPTAVLAGEFNETATRSLDIRQRTALQNELAQEETHRTRRTQFLGGIHATALPLNEITDPRSLESRRYGRLHISPPKSRQVISHDRPIRRLLPQNDHCFNIVTNAAPFERPCTTLPSTRPAHERAATQRPTSLPGHATQGSACEPRLASYRPKRRLVSHEVATQRDSVQSLLRESDPHEARGTLMSAGGVRAHGSVHENPTSMEERPRTADASM
eukprot:gnl/Trimastix_PCT/3384.p1 GENE.gnl/Trimastix_PCT/3384~~gnl/Trimastix_PCT/3384.p1  ORF type:complete len:391 (+),score=24.65 gnl/Trimastix_PCT/3384:77-1249(+)